MVVGRMHEFTLDQSMCQHLNKPSTSGKRIENLEHCYRTSLVTKRNRANQLGDTEGCVQMRLIQWLTVTVVCFV